jgi:hypothetical protein
MKLRNASGSVVQAFGEQAGRGAAVQALREIQGLISDIETDYKFSIGDVATVLHILPHYGQQADELLTALRQAAAPGHGTKAVIDSLAAAAEEVKAFRAVK